MSPGINRGELFWLAADASQGSVAHPHVVIHVDVGSETLTVCALTSNLTRAKEPGNVLLDAGEGGLTKRSVVLAAQVFSVERARLGERIGSLSSARVDEVIAGVKFIETSFRQR